MAVAPGGRPARFRLQKNEYQLSRTWGPERIETGWWRGGYVRRDYYRVETTGGERFWIFRRLTDRQWFLQGEDG
jgi:protein ImuB